MTKQSIKTNSLMVLCLSLGVIGSYYVTPEKIEYKQVEVQKEPPTQEQIIERTAKAIYDSSEFQREMNETVKARALYQLSIEQQDTAVSLSERAVEANSNSQLLADAWMYNHSSSTSDKE